MAAKDSLARKRIMEGEPKAPLSFPRFTTGCTLLDLNVGGGQGMGLKAGTLVNVVAIEGAGKTQLSAECIAHNYHRSKREGSPFWWRYIDRERRFSFDTDKMFGVTVCDPSEDVPETLEEFDGYVGKLLDEAKSPGIIVADSLDAFSTMETEARAEKRVDLYEAGKDVKNDGSYTVKTGPSAFFSESLRVRMSQASDKQVLLLYLSQVRCKLNAMQFDPNKFQRNGGQALKHWCDTVIWLRPLHYITVGKAEDQTLRDVGVVVKAWTEKSSTPRPFRECIYTILFDYGIDNTGSNVDYLFNLRDPKRGTLETKEDTLISWKEGAEKTLENVVQWLEGLGRIQEARDAKKAETGKPNLSLAWLDEWIAKDPGLQAAYAEAFPCYTRDQLIRAVEADPEMERELERRVVAKWEGIERDAASNRRSKFNG
jgi:RecA/RadA recombinase